MRNREFVKASISDFDETMNLIPAEILALPGYGWSAGSVYNEVDWENKKYIQRVASVDLDDLSWDFSTTNRAKTASLASVLKKPASVLVLGNYLSDKFVQIAVRGSLVAGEFACDQQGQLIFYSDDRVTPPSGMLFYELATPIETDISALIDDNTIEVESGGSLTFENTNGDSYRIPVPSTVLTAQQGS